MTRNPDQETVAGPAVWPARRWRVLLSATAVASLAAVGLVPTPSHAQATECTSSLTGVTVGDLEVPDGEACTLTNVQVAGTATVGVGADLFLNDTNVSNFLIVNSSAFAQVTRSTISERVSLVNAFGLLAEDSTLSSGVGVDGGRLFSTASNLSGSVDSSTGWTFIEAGQISGNVTTDHDQASDLVDVSMSGQLRVGAATDGSVICRSTISGLVEVTGSGGTVQLGGEQPAPDCGSNVFNGDVVLDSNNADSIVVASNMIFGDLICVNNTPAPSGSGNMVHGEVTDQCAGFGSASSTQEVPVAEAGNPEDRRQALLDALAERAHLE